MCDSTHDIVCGKVRQFYTCGLDLKSQSTVFSRVLSSLPKKEYGVQHQGKFTDTVLIVQPRQEAERKQVAPTLSGAIRNASL